METARLARIEDIEYTGAAGIPVGIYNITRGTTFVAVPEIRPHSTSTGTEGTPVSLEYEVTYDKPLGDRPDSEFASDAEWFGYETKTDVGAEDTPHTNRTYIVQSETGITGVRVIVRGSGGSSSGTLRLRTYIYNLERR